MNYQAVDVPSLFIDKVIILLNYQIIETQLCFMYMSCQLVCGCLFVVVVVVVFLNQMSVIFFNIPERVLDW